MEFKLFEGTTYADWLEYHTKKGGTYYQIVKAMIDSEEKKTPGQRMMIINHMGKEKD
jgi:hypothetical protein